MLKPNSRGSWDESPDFQFNRELFPAFSHIRVGEVDFRGPRRQLEGHNFERSEESWAMRFRVSLSFRRFSAKR